MKAQQLEAQQLPDKTWDVVVVGGGPAGCAAAIELGRRGRSVLLVDKGRFPRDKVCGDMLVSDSLRVLARLEALEQVRGRAYPITQAQVFSTQQYSVQLSGQFLTIKRATFDGLLADAAARHGVTLAQGFVSDLRLLDWGLECRVDNSHRVWARLALLATGADTHLPRRVGVHLAAAGPEAVAVRCYVKSKARMRHVVVSYDRSSLPGYSWIFPLGDGEFNVGCILFEPGDPGPLLQRFLQTFPLARYLMSEHSYISEAAAAPLRCGFPSGLPVGEGRVILAGETIYTTLPFSGEGIGTALESGSLAGVMLDEALANPDLLRQWRIRLNDQMSQRYAGYETAQRWMSRRWLNDLMAWRVLHSVWLRHRVEELFSSKESMDPTRIFSLSGLLHSLHH